MQDECNFDCCAGTGAPPPECTPAIMQKVAYQHLMSPAILCILPLQVCLLRHCLANVYARHVVQ